MPDVKERAYEDYIAGMKYKDIAAKYGVSMDTVKSWKRRYGWNRKKGCTQNTKRVHTKKECIETVEEEVELVMENTDLTEKQLLFCLYYSKTFNATKSYQKAYGCSYQTAMANGSAALKNTKIREAILRLKKSRYSRALLEPEDIFQKYIEIAFADMTNYVTFGSKEVEYIDKAGNEQAMTVSYVELQESAEVDGTIISEISQGKDGVKVKLADQMKALQWLSDHMDLATEMQKAQIEKIRCEVSRMTGENKGNSLAEAIKKMEARRNG